MRENRCIAHFLPEVEDVDICELQTLDGGPDNEQLVDCNSIRKGAGVDGYMILIRNTWGWLGSYRNVPLHCDF